MINIKQRFKNAAFVISFFTLLVSAVYKILSVLNVVPAIPANDIVTIISIIVDMLVGLGVLIDPTTEGISDSSRAMTYGTDCDVRFIEDDIDLTEGDDDV